MQKSVRVVAAIAFIALGVWGWRSLFPSPEKAIRSRLAKLAETVSFEPSDGAYPKLRKVDKVGTFFTPDVEVSLEARGFAPRSFSGRDELQDAARFALGNFRGLKVEFLDINVTLGEDRQQAVANLTAKATVTGETDFYVVELNVLMKKVDGDWLIYKVETVKTLALTASSRRPHHYDS
jgi:hypothetical protein